MLLTLLLLNLQYYLNCAFLLQKETTRERSLKEQTLQYFWQTSNLQINDQHVL